MSSYPDLVAYHSIAITLGQAGHMKELFDVIDTMHSPPKKKFKTGALGKWDPRLEPDIIVYNAVCILTDTAYKDSYGIFRFHFQLMCLRATPTELQNA